jgi:hypothetical protein
MSARNGQARWHGRWLPGWHGMCEVGASAPGLISISLDEPGIAGRTRGVALILLTYPTRRGVARSESDEEVMMGSSDECFDVSGKLLPGHHL